MKQAFDGTNGRCSSAPSPARREWSGRPAQRERRDLRAPGRGRRRHAAGDVRILVVGNPCNTNCLIARSAAPDMPADRWFAMTGSTRTAPSPAGQQGGRPGDRGDERRHLGQPLATQYPDFENARIDGKAVPAVIKDGDWLRGEFIATVQQRGTRSSRRRGASSAASAANAVGGLLRSIVAPTAKDDCVSLAVVSHGEYGTPEGLVFGLPIRSDGSTWHVVQGLEHSDFARDRIRVTTEELESERPRSATCWADCSGGCPATAEAV